MDANEEVDLDPLLGDDIRPIFTALNRGVQSDYYQAPLLTILEHTRHLAGQHPAHAQHGERRCCSTTGRLIKAFIPETKTKKALSVVAIAVAAISCKVYWDLAYLSPSTSDASRIYKALSSTITQLVLASFYLYRPFADDIDANATPPQIRDSLMRLQDDHFSGWSYRKKQYKSAATIALRIMAALPASLIMGWISYSDANGSAFFSVIISLVNVGLNYASTQGAVELFRALFPSQWLQRTCCSRSKTSMLQYDIETLRNVVLENLAHKKSFFLRCMQKQRADILAPLYLLLNAQSSEGIAQSNHLLLSLLQHNNAQVSRSGFLKGIAQLIGAAGTTISCTSYYLSTAKGIQNIWSTSRPGALAGAAFLYSVPLALFLNVSRCVVGPIYDLFADIFSCRGINLGLSFQQNLISMMTLTIASLGITSGAYAPALALNELYKDELGGFKSVVDVCCVIFIWYFVWFPFSELGSTYQASYQRINTLPANINQMHLMDFCNAIQQQFQQMTPHAVLRYFSELNNKLRDQPGDFETTCRAFFSHQSPSEVFTQAAGATHRYSDADNWRAVIEDLVSREHAVELQSRNCCRLFRQPRADSGENQHLLGDDLSEQLYNDL